MGRMRGVIKVHLTDYSGALSPFISDCQSPDETKQKQVTQAQASFNQSLILEQISVSQGD
jgi:hypothetical protein